LKDNILPTSRLMLVRFEKGKYLSGEHTSNYVRAW